MRSIDPDTGKQIVALKNHIIAGFNDSHWRELGILTNQIDAVNDHPRLLRSLSFGDDDYEGHVLSMLQKMVAADPSYLDIITDYVKTKCPEAGEYISSEGNDARRIVFSPNVFRVPEGNVDRSLVSVMMPFASNFGPVYSSIKSAASSAGLACKRADDIWDDSTVIQDIFSLIFRSHIVVCDFTGMNANVFYEAGIAHTLGKHVIPITQESDHIPFDLRHHRYIQYLNNSEGLDVLRPILSNRFKTLAAKPKPMPWD
ncbi:hypothetical protein [Candidatus Laterigemmans baculatus]|uniref:hypothetical protein n=1 Tax=Candidatus Laterigemmans baculatus TaxID=2770505 RepID=UPI00193C5517|nr:hypothetical protein [Candidatus Laterigemmans baculatus]